MSPFEIALAVATVLGGLSGLLYFWDRLRKRIPADRRPEIRRKGPVSLFRVASNGMFHGTNGQLARLIDEVRHSLSKGDAGAVQVRLASLDSVRKRLLKLERKRRPSAADVSELARLRTEFDRIEEAQRRCEQGISLILSEPLLTHRGQLSSTEATAECITWFFWLHSAHAAKPFNPWKEGFTGIDIYRVRPPELFATTWLAPDEASELDGIDRTGFRFDIRAGRSVTEFPDHLLRKRVIPLVVTTVVRAERQGAGPFESDVFNLAHWYFGLH